MATKIVTKNSSTASAVPTASDLVQGELAVNVADKKLFTEDNSGAIIELADGVKLAGIEASADVTDTANVTAAGAVMDSELTSEASVKALNQGVATTDSPDFAALNVNGTATMDGLTVDGVAKVLGTAGNTLIIADATETNGYQLKANTGASADFGFLIETLAAKDLFKVESNNDISFYEDTGTTPKLFWDASAESLGIGESNPAAKLHLNSASTTAIMFDSDTSTQQYELGVGYGGVGTSSFYLFDNTANASRLVVNSSGNVGIGTATANHFSTAGATNILGVKGTSGGLISIAATGTNFSGLDLGTDTTRRGGIYSLDGSNLAFYTNATNSGGSLTERMRIDSSGNVGIGTSAPAVKFHTTSGVARVNTAKTETAFFATDDDDDFRFGLAISHKGGTTDADRYASLDSTAYRISTDTFSAGGSLVLQELGGNVGIGITPATLLDIKEGTAATDAIIGLTAGTGGRAQIRSEAQADNTSSELSFHTMGGSSTSERLRIDSSGNLLVGTTDTSSSGASGIKLKPDDGGADKPIVAISTAGYQTEVAFSLYSTAVAAWRFFVQANGTISAVNTTITSLSDQRVKENVRDLDDGLAKVMQLQPRKFDWKEGKGKDISDDRGFIAQEFEQVFPDMISEWKDEAPEGEEAYKAINANLIPTLVKAIQEQQTLIESLTARIAALES